jgi:hypothetical protein
MEDAVRIEVGRCRRQLDEYVIAWRRWKDALRRLPMRLLSLNLTGGPNNRVGVTVSLSLKKDSRMEPITNHARSWVMIHGAEVSRVEPFGFMPLGFVNRRLL